MAPRTNLPYNGDRTPLNDTSILTRKHWIFDLDGTLTVPKHDFGYIRQVLGVPADMDILGFLSGLPDERSAALHQKLNEIELRIAQETEAAAGVEFLLSRLSSEHVKMGILTRNTRHHATVSLEAIGLEAYFSEATILGRDEATPKPDPDGINRLLGLWAADSGDAVMVGDYLFDLETGRSAGVGTIHVDDTALFLWPELTDLGVNNLDELQRRIPVRQHC